MSTLGVILVVFDLSCDILKSSGGVDLDKLLDMSNQDRMLDRCQKDT